MVYVMMVDSVCRQNKTLRKADESISNISKRHKNGKGRNNREELKVLAIVHFTSIREYSYLET